MKKQIEFEIVESDRFTCTQEVINLPTETTLEIYTDIKARFETGVSVDQLLKQVLNDYTDAELVMALICFGYGQYHNNVMKHQLGLCEHED